MTMSVGPITVKILNDLLVMCAKELHAQPGADDDREMLLFEISEALKLIPSYVHMGCTWEYQDMVACEGDSCRLELD